MDSTSSRYGSEGSYFPPMEPTLSASYEKSANYVAAHSKSGYADFVQGLNPTWSQSPAPSPNIIKEDPNINPFFFQPLTSYPAMDDDAFDPPDPTPDSTEDGHSSASEHVRETRSRSGSIPRTRAPLHTPSSRTPLPPPPSSILANARSLIHIPLYRSMDRNSQRYLPSDIRHQRPPAMPVGIISFLSDQVPYPPEALDVLMELNPYLANQVTNALRMEDVVARSSRWGDISTSSLSDGLRTKETFAESIQRKMKDTYDVGTPRPMAPNLDTPRAGLAQSLDRHQFEYTQEKAAAKVSTPPTGSYQQPQQSRLPKGLSSTSVCHDAQNAAGVAPSQRDLSKETEDDLIASESWSSKDGKPSSEKQPESFYNLDTTTDEIHRTLNFLNLDVTGSATCPLAPQTKRMLGKHHYSAKNVQSHRIENGFLSSWAGHRRRAESSPHVLDTEEQDADDMWQTLPSDEPDQRPHSLPNTRIMDNELPGHESPYFGSIRSLSPSNIPKRHLFSAGKRTGLGRRRRSMKDHPKNLQNHTSASPVASSPYTPTIPGFCSHQFDASSSSVDLGGLAFSPDPSPMASPMVHQSGIFGQAFTTLEPRPNLEDGPYSKPQSSSHNRDRVERERAPLSRHGSGWSINSDDTNLASPGANYDKHQAGRKHRKKHHAVPSDRSAHNPFPRTRLLRLIVDAISHHVL